MTADSLRTQAALESLHDLLEPAPVSMIPESVGWKIAAAIGLILGLWLLWRIIRQRRLTRYRREAISELEQIESLVGHADGVSVVSRLSTLLKRTALSGYDRARVAALAGEDWLRFLDQTGGGSNFTERGQLLVEYGATTVPEEQLRALVQLVRAWIRGHRVETRA